MTYVDIVNICGYLLIFTIRGLIYLPLSAEGDLWIYLDLCGLIYQNSPQCRLAWEHPHTVQCQRGKVSPAARRCTPPQAPC